MHIPWMRYLLLLVLALILGVGSAWFLRSFDPVETVVRGDLSVQARANPWLALETFLRASGAQVTTPEWDTLWQSEWPQDLTIISNRLDQVLDPHRLAQLMEWIEQGGDVLLPLPALPLGDGDVTELGGLLAELGISLSYEFPLEEEETLLSFQFDGSDETISIEFDSAYSILSTGSREPTGSLSTDDAVHSLQFELGHGKVTVFSDGRFLRNRWIGQHDHAWFIYEMTAAGDGREVWLLPNYTQQSLGAWVWQHAWLFLLFSLMLLMLWVWQQSMTLGPKQHPAAAIRRHLGEHLRASANFLWRQQQTQALFQAACHRVLQRWQKHHPGLHEQGLEAQWRWIGQHAGMNQEDSEWLAQYASWAMTDRAMTDSMQPKSTKPKIRDHECLRLGQYLQRLMGCNERGAKPDSSAQA